MSSTIDIVVVYCEPATQKRVVGLLAVPRVAAVRYVHAVGDYISELDSVSPDIVVQTCADENVVKSCRAYCVGSGVVYIGLGNISDVEVSVSEDKLNLLISDLVNVLVSSKTFVDEALGVTAVLNRFAEVQNVDDS